MNRSVVTSWMDQSSMRLSRKNCFLVYLLIEPSCVKGLFTEHRSHVVGRNIALVFEPVSLVVRHKS
jgi:hypothetical protein